MNEKYEKTKNLIGREKMVEIANANVLICGLGGVGGYVAEMVARLGINNIHIVDFDTVSLSNFNRQIIAIDKNIGKFKTDCIKERILEINKNANIYIYNEKIDDQFFIKYDNNFSNIDFIFDCIDDKNGKINIYKYSKSKNINIISSMGTGRNTNFNFKIDDISKTKNCPLAKVMRKLCIDNNIKNIKVIYNDIDNDNKKDGTIPTLPSIAGILMVQYYLNYHIKI